MKVGTLVIKKTPNEVCPKNCIEADGSWYTKDIYPKLYDIFKDCKCLLPHFDELTGVVNTSVKGIFHTPNSYGKAWIVCKESV